MDDYEYLIQLDDLLEDRINQDDPNIQYIITSSLEFRELAAEERENPPPRFKRFKHQEFFCRLMAQIDTQLVIDDPGTGKSCLASSICEYLYTQKMKMLNDDRPYDEKNAHFKHIHFICGSSTLQDEFRRQVMKTCTDRFIDENDSEKRVKQLKEFSRWYKLETYLKFAKKISELSDESILEIYSDCVFIIEEAHNVILNGEMDIKGEIKDIKQKEMVYNALLRLFNLISNSKIILLTATPMLNSTSEIIQLMNLILKNKPFPKKFNVEKATMEDLEPYFRGKISYVRALKSNVKIVEKLNKNDKPQEYNLLVNGKNIKITSNLYKSHMSDFQAKNYAEVIGRKSTNDLAGINTAVLQASMFIFPDGYYGKGYTEEERQNMNEINRQNKKLSELNEDDLGDEYIFVESAESVEKRGARKYFNIGVDDKKVVYGGITDDFRLFFKDEKNKLEKIKKLSCKIYEIIKNILDRPGNVFVYSDLKPAGIFAVAACLEIMGFTRYNDADSAFDRKNNVSTLRKNIKKSNGVDVPFKFALFTDSTTDRKKDVMLELMNSYENRHGEYIRVFLASRVGRDGINVANVLQIHMLAPGWNKAAMIQATARGLRSLSHKDLLKELPPGEELEVDIFNHCAIYPPEPDRSIDLIRYRIVEDKGYRISRILRIMKIFANGCQLNKKRNIRKGTDYSFECDYDKCDYECWGPIFNPETDEIRTVNYDLLYSGEKIDLIMDKIINIYKYYNTLNFEELYGILNDNPKHIALALEKIIKNKFNFRDRFGFLCYLRENNGCFYTEREYPLINNTNNCSLSFYSQGVIGIKINNIETIMSESKADNIYNISEIIESIIIKIIDNKELNEYEVEQFNKYKSFIFNLGTPETLLSLANEGPKNKKVPRNKPTGIKEKKGITEEMIENYLDSDEYKKKDVYVHILSSLSGKVTNYSSTFGFNKAQTDIRVISIPKYKAKNIGWRDMGDNESKVYAKIITEINKKYYKEFEENFDFYGIKLKEGNFLIKDLRAKKINSELYKKDSAGTACIGYSKKELFELFWTMKLDIKKYSNIKPDLLSDFSKEELYDEIIKKKTIVKNPKVEEILKRSRTYDVPFDKWSKERLLYYHNLFKCFRDLLGEGNESENLCDILEKEFDQRKQLLT